MLVNTVSYLLFIAIAALLRFRARFNKIVVPLLSFSAIAIFYYFVQDMLTGTESVTTLLWDSSKSGNIKIDVVSSVNNYQMILPFFAITVLALINNLFFRFEPDKRNFAAILILNLLSLIMLIAGNNLIQIITFVFVIDILSQLFIKDIYASRRYSIYNLIADMGLFLVMAMLKSKLETLDVANMVHYYETGRHRDFIMFVIMISLFIKFGFFLFQSYLLDLKNTKFHRLILIPYLSTPMVALILFIKFYPLLVVSPSFYTCLNIAVTLTMLWGSIGAIVINNLKEKTVYLNMLIIALSVKIVQCYDFVWNIQISLLLILGFCLNLCLYYTHYGINRENNLLSVGSAQTQNKIIFKLTIVVYTLIASALCCVLAASLTPDNTYWIYLFLILFPLCSSHIFAQIISVLPKNVASKTDYLPIIPLVICSLLSYFVIEQHSKMIKYAIYFTVIFAILIKIYPLKLTFENKLLNQKLQKIDFFAHIYDIILVNPVKIIGRWLTVLFDFVFIEKTVAIMFSSINNITIRSFRKAARNWVAYYFFNFALGIIIVIWCFFKGNK